MKVVIHIARPACCPCCAADEASDAMKLKAFIERVKNILGERTEIELIFTSSKDTPKVVIDGKEISSGRYPDTDDLASFLI